MIDLEAKLKQLRELFSNSLDLTDSDRYMILATLATDSASSLVMTPDGKFHRDWIADNLSDIIGYNLKELDNFEKWEKIVHPEDVPAYRKSVERIISGSPVSAELRIICADKKVMWINNTVFPLKDKDGRVVRLISAVKDITERKMYEKEMFKSQRLESLGLLAGGIAHDFNNILTSILGNVSLAKNISSGSVESVNYLSNAEKSIDAAKALTRQLLTFARGGEPVFSLVDPVPIVKESAGLCLSGSAITARFKGDDRAYRVQGERNQIFQLVQNILINAAQAMAWNGVIDIDFMSCNLTEEKRELAAGKYFCLKIRDYGEGIAEENIDHIFDPFFTTREHGSGLGLSVAHSIVKRHGGCIFVNPSSAGGTEFEIYLPEAGGDIAAATVKENTVYKSSGHVLVMDDDTNIIKMLKSMLEMMGFSCDFAHNGEDAIKLYKDSLDRGSVYDFIILDLTVSGGMGGLKCAEKITDLDSSVKIVFSSGYSSEIINPDVMKPGKVAFLEKPYSMEELAGAISYIEHV